MSDKPIYVTQPFLPPLEDFMPLLKQVWDSRVLTNSGPFHEELEARVAEYLNVPYVSLFANGTLALVTALQALRITGEVITTPYSFVATSHALLWNGLKPVFVDVNEDSLNLDPTKIESAITTSTTAILPVHVYGRPCAVESIQEIADTYGLKVLYDAAHAFGVNCHCQNLFSHGDASVISFHATKVFNTFEGGAIVCDDLKLKRRIDYLKNFGFADETTVVAPGINGKMNEFSAALGCLQLDHIDDVISRRKKVFDSYAESLSDIEGIRLPDFSDSAEHNYAYYPTMIQESSKLDRDEVYLRLKEKGIFSRRYFYPLISRFPMYRSLPSANPAHLEVAEAASRKVICLPMYPDLTESDQGRVIDAIRALIY